MVRTRTPRPAIIIIVTRAETRAKMRTKARVIIAPIPRKITETIKNVRKIRKVRRRERGHLSEAFSK